MPVPSEGPPSQSRCQSKSCSLGCRRPKFWGGQHSWVPAHSHPALEPDPGCRVRASGASAGPIVPPARPSVRDAQQGAICVPLPVASPRPLSPSRGTGGSSPPGSQHKPPAQAPSIPTHRGASAHGAAGSAHRTSRASSYLFRERKKEKKAQHLAALLLFFFSL